MRNKYTSLTIILLFCLAYNTQAQTEQELGKIKNNLNASILNTLQAEFQSKFEADEEKVADYLAKNPTVRRTFVRDGSTYYLRRIDSEGNLVYINTKNRESGALIKADQLYTGGSLEINIAGQNMIAGIWDGGQVRASHELLQGRVGMQPGQNFDGSGDNFGGNNHQTHVSGTIVGKNIANQPSARGIAHEATARNYDWNNDLAEMTSFAGAGFLISNHSYGYLNDESIPIWQFGAYDSQAQEWDMLLKNTPNYLPFIAIGNEQQSSGNGTKGGYDIVTGASAAKNVMTVGAVNGDKTMSDYSNWGPTDDGRVKPEIVAKGTGINSSLFADPNTNLESDVSYSGNDVNSSGTSYAAPAAAAGGLLLQQYFNSLHGNYMKAATLKALMLTTAEDLGQPGPDHKFGWGLLNIEKAANAIKNKSSSGSPGSQQVQDTDSKGSYIEEISYNIPTNGTERQIIIRASGTEPLIAAIAWTDDEGSEQTQAEGVDPTASRLVHEFDLLVRHSNSGTDTRPWKPTSMANRTANAAVQSGWFDGNNNNYKQVKISNPVAGAEYRILIRKKSTSPSTLKPVSLVVTGTFAQVCPSELTLIDPANNASSGSTTFQAGEKIIASNRITGNANVIMKAGKSIELKPSPGNGGNTFEAASGTIFSASISGCANN